MEPLGRAEDAAQVFRRALEIQQSLVVQDPADIMLQSSLAGIHNNLGIILEDLGHSDQAVAAYRQAVDHQRVAYERAATVRAIASS